VKLNETRSRLKDLLADSIRSESTLDLPAVGIVGAPNAGKSTLLNKLLGRQRSIVSHQRKTTRDVLTGEFELPGCRCVLFDCAGLITKSENILDELAQQAAIEAIRNAMVVVFCVDIAKSEWAEDLSIRRLINPVHLMAIATKTDLLSEKVIAERLSKLKSLFGRDFLPVSAQKGEGLQQLKEMIARKIIERATVTSHEPRVTSDVLTLTTRHRQSLNNAIHDIVQAEKEIKAGSEELAAMMLRTAYNQLSDIEQHNIDEQVLDRIFSRFCIGK
jgi:tRNA modification GTPase